MTDTDDTSTAARAKKIIGEILIGRADGGLVEIAKACAVRRKETGTVWQWRMTFKGTVAGVDVDDTWDQDTVTIGELATAEKLIGDGTSYVEIDPRLSIWHRVVLLVARLHKMHNVPMAQALNAAEGLSHQEQVDMIDMYEVVPPKDEDSTSS